CRARGAARPPRRERARRRLRVRGALARALRPETPRRGPGFTERLDRSHGERRGRGRPARALTSSRAYLAPRLSPRARRGGGPLAPRAAERRQEGPVGLRREIREAVDFTKAEPRHVGMGAALGVFLGCVPERCGLVALIAFIVGLTDTSAFAVFLVG